jgi:hypothetical protein
LAPLEEEEEDLHNQVHTKQQSIERGEEEKKNLAE